MKARLLVELKIKPDEVDSFVEMFEGEFIARSRKEDGCEQYELWQDPEAPENMTIVEVWSSQAHLDTHLAQDWFGDWAPKMEAAQAQPMVIKKLVSTEEK